MAVRIKKARAPLSLLKTKDEFPSLTGTGFVYSPTGWYEISPRSLNYWSSHFVMIKKALGGLVRVYCLPGFGVKVGIYFTTQTHNSTSLQVSTFFQLIGQPENPYVIFLDQLLDISEVLANAKSHPRFTADLNHEPDMPWDQQKLDKIAHFLAWQGLLRFDLGKKGVANVTFTTFGYEGSFSGKVEWLSHYLKHTRVVGVV